MARTADQLTNEETIIVQNLENLADTASNEVVAKVGGTFVNKVLPNVLLFKGAIAAASDFPTLALVQTGWFYKVTTNVTDNDVTKTNTGLSFLAGEEIAWDGSTWVELGTDNAVVGPASAVDSNFAAFDSTTGKLIKDSGFSSSSFVKLDQTTPQAVINGSLIMEGIQFDITPSTSNASEGLLRWNSTDGTLDLGMSGGDITQQIGQEMYVKARNDTGATINNGSVVYISGRTGVFPDIKLARSDADTTARVLGVATQDILNTGDKFGYITTFGYVRGIKTDYTGAGNWGNTWATGDVLYVSKTVAGQLTNIEPSAPHHSDIVGTVGVVSATQGSILVINEKHQTLEGLTDVNGTALTVTGQIPVWNNTAGYFDFNYNITNYAPLASPTFTGTVGLPLLQFNTSPTVGSFSEGKIYYDATWKTLSAEIDTDVTMQIGQEDLVYCYNGTGSPITNGKVVYIAGASGGFPSIALADATDVNKSFVLGVVTTSSIASGGYGFVTVRGNVNNIDTSAWTVGTILYLSDVTPGMLTSTAPSAGNFDVKVARVMSQDASTGRIFVNVRQLEKLSDLGDVTITTPTLDQILRYNGTEWVNGSPAATSAGAGVEFYFSDTNIISTGTNNINQVNTLLKTPDTNSQVVDSWNCTNNTVLGEAFLYNTALDRTTLPAGTWTFDTYASVSSVAGGRVSFLTRSISRVRPSSETVTTTGTGTSRTATASSGTNFSTLNIDTGGTLITDSYLQTPQGLYRITARTSDTVVTIETPTTYANETGVAFSVWKSLFNVAGQTITSTGTNYSLFVRQYTQQNDITVAATDKLGCIMFATSNNTTTVNFVHSGTTNNSHFTTPFAVLHGNIAGLQGGTGTVPSEEYYHLTLAQHTIATQAATTSVAGYLTNTDWNTFNGKAGLTAPTFVTSITTPSVLATANDSGALGASGTAFSDLFLASGGIINWDAGNATLTHSTGLLTSNVPLSLGTSNTFTCGTIELGHASANTLSASGGVLSIEGIAIPKGTGTSNEIAYWSGTNTLGTLAVATYPSLTELSYVKGVTSAIQTQFTGKRTTALTAYSDFNLQEGAVFNGKIVPSVASNNLTVAIKGMDGNDPSASNPVYVRIGSTIRSITAALSVTNNAGALFNAGSAELATKELDYFVYLYWNSTTSEVGIGYSRVPYFTIAAESPNGVAEKYISCVSPVAGQTYLDSVNNPTFQLVNIGRFAATLSAGPGYTWSVPTFTASNLIQRPIYETRWLTWTPTYTASGSMTFTLTTQQAAVYKISYDNCFIQFGARGETGGTASTDINVSKPFGSSYAAFEIGCGAVCYDGAVKGGLMYPQSGLFVFNKYDVSNWGLGATKDIKAIFNYKI